MSVISPEESFSFTASTAAMSSSFAFGLVLPRPTPSWSMPNVALPPPVKVAFSTASMVR